MAESVVVFARGDVSDGARAYAERKLDDLSKLAPGPVLFARVELTAHADPARERSAFAKAELDVNGRFVRAHAAAATMLEAIDALDLRLRERLGRAAHHEEAEHLRLRGDEEHQWRHGQYSPPRPSSFPRPVDEREIVRHKSFAFGDMTADEAADDLELLDHDFFLFTNVETGEDNVITRVGRSEGSGYELMEPAATCSLAETAAPIHHSDVRPASMTVDDARGVLDMTDRPFVFFLDPDDRRGRILYRRYDGNYGLIVGADEEPE